MYLCIFLQAEDGMRDLVRFRGLGDVYKRQVVAEDGQGNPDADRVEPGAVGTQHRRGGQAQELSFIHILRCRRAV